MLISVIIPCKTKDENVANLIKDLEEQEFPDKFEVIVIEGIYPVGKARNEGARKAKGNVLVFMDQDIRLGNKHIIEGLATPLINDRKIGMVVTSIKLPPDATDFEKKYTSENFLSELPVMDELTEIGTAPSGCCSILKELFESLNGFNEEMVRGEDSEFSFRLRKKDYKIMMAPQTWYFHHQPQNFIQMISRQIRNGLGVAFVDVYYPELNIDIHPTQLMYELERKSIIGRIFRFIGAYIKGIVNMRLLYMISRIIYSIAYMYGIFKYKVLKCG